MAGNTFGTIFCVTTFGESHGAALGCVVDGCPAGLSLFLDDIRRELARRKPGGGAASTSRDEADEPEILSGVFEGKTLGTPIAIIVRNRDHHSGDYEALKNLYRPGHADWAWDAKYGFRDHRGGGRSSGRETIGRVAAGAVAKALLKMYGISIHAWTSMLAGIEAPAFGSRDFDLDEAERNSLRVPGKEAADRMLVKIDENRQKGDSLGGIVSCRVDGLPPGLGAPVFGKLDALLASALMSIGACKGVEFGAGFAAVGSLGSKNNDTLFPGENRYNWDLPPGVPPAFFRKNDSGGVLGGLSNGAPLEFRAAFKPIPSIPTAQETINKSGSPATIEVRGRHDICVCPRAVPDVEAMTALVLADLLLLAKADRAGA